MERFALEHPVRWDPCEKEFYEYQADKGLWSIVSSDTIKRQVALDFKRAADDTGLKGFCLKRTDGKLAAITKALRGATEKRDSFKKKPSVMHLANGMLDLRVSPPKLMSFHPSYNSRNISPMVFDPEAECPRFIEELLGSALDEDDIDLFQRWAGSVLLGMNSAQRILLLTGTAGGGKSTLIEILQKMIGEENAVELRTKLLGRPFEVQRYLKKTLLVGVDVKADFLSEDNIGVLKSLVGNDLLHAERKYDNLAHEIRGNFNIVITSNAKLRMRLDGDTGAWARRLLAIEYTKEKAKVRVDSFAEKLLQEEKSGILRWLVKGAIEYLAEIEEFGDMRLSQAQKNRVELLLQESDCVQHFIKKCVVTQKNGDVTVNELHDGYLEHCEHMGWQCLKSHEFRRNLRVVMENLHGVPVRHDIMRHLKHERGFKHVQLQGGL